MNVYTQERVSVRKRISLDCKVLRSRDMRVIGERMLDLSPDGMLLSSTDPVLLREPVLITFRLPSLSRTFTAEGEVARILQGRRPKDHGRAIGVRFQNFDALSRMLVRTELRRVPPPLPSRAKRLDYAGLVKRIDLGKW